MNSRINVAILPPIQAIEVTGRNGLCSTAATIAAFRCRADCPCVYCVPALAAALVALSPAFAAPLPRRSPPTLLNLTIWTPGSK